MNNNMKRRRINCREFADRLACHPATVKRRIKQREPGFPMPTMIMGKWTWAEDEVDAYVEYLIKQGKSAHVPTTTSA